MRLVDRPSRARLERDKLCHLLRSCSDLDQGRRLHERICQIKDTSLFSSLLVCMYTRCGDLETAKNLFLSMPQADTFAMNTMITAYAKSQEIATAKQIFDEAPSRNAASWAVLVAALAVTGDLDSAVETFDRAPGRNISMCTTMIASSKVIQHSKTIFDDMPERDLIAWNAMVTAYALSGQIAKAREALDRMPGYNMTSCTPLIYACASNGDEDEARSLYSRIPYTSSVMSTAVARRGSCAFFQDLGNRNVISWTALLDSISRSGDIDQTRKVFDAMPQHDAVTWRSMVAALARCGDSNSAKSLFESMPERDLASWTTMIKAFAENATRADEIYRKMPGHDAVATGAMIMAFANSGHFHKARELFAASPEKTPDRGTWNAMIAASARFGGVVDGAEQLVQSMCAEGVEPDELSFMAALVAHSHAGALDAAGQLFRSMGQDHGMDLNQEHYWAMIDALARVGRIADAEELVDSMPFLPDDVLLRVDANHFIDYLAADVKIVKAEMSRRRGNF